MSPAPRGAVALFVLLVACSCQRNSSPRLRIAEVRVSERKHAPGVSRSEVRAWVYERLSAAKALELVERPAAGAYRLDVDVAVGELVQELGERGGGRAVLLAAIAERPDEVEGIVLRTTRLIPLDGGRAEVQREPLRAGVRALVDSIDEQARLAVGPAELLVEALRGKDPTRVAVAVEIAAARRSRAAVPALIKLLAHKDPRVADRAIGALAAVGDRQAVRALTRLSRFSDTERLAKVLDAIESLGGQEARAYLEFVASGHEDADIRNLAAEALARLQRRGGAEPVP